MLIGVDLSRVLKLLSQHWCKNVTVWHPCMYHSHHWQIQIGMYVRHLRTYGTDVRTVQMCVQYRCMYGTDICTSWMYMRYSLCLKKCVEKKSLEIVLFDCTYECSVYDGYQWGKLDLTEQLLYRNTIAICFSLCAHKFLEWLLRNDLFRLNSVYFHCEF